MKNTSIQMKRDTVYAVGLEMLNKENKFQPHEKSLPKVTSASLKPVLILVTSHLLKNKILFPDFKFLPEFFYFGFLILLTVTSCTTPYLQFYRTGCYTDLGMGWGDGDEGLGSEGK